VDKKPWTKDLTPAIRRNLFYHGSYGKYKGFFLFALIILFVIGRKLEGRKNNLTQKAGGEITGN